MTGIPKMTDLILVNTPISSPLHAQLNLPLLKGAMEAEGISSPELSSDISEIEEMSNYVSICKIPKNVFPLNLFIFFE